ncbi:MAG: DegT/DnrJ/EryC1/StrS family aminotransferase [Verrucomicrobia bacterium]|nr:DegT/DnrJ/EryC1/StrS family aminotransferase [Verrucomicrobiota bacterium]MBU1910343.1 DegT/DnrJ/EryC1/StrS family aminotransferase [Verrucomicrobiota bacterium]
MIIQSAKPCLDEADRAAILRVFDAGLIAEGGDIERFEVELAAFLRMPGAVAVSSGFAALHLALKALEVGCGDEVIIPCVSTCPALRNAVWAAGATPVYADINRNDFNLSIDSVGTAMTPRTRAIIAPHHTGIPADIPGLIALKIPVIEDCAQAIGASWRGRPVGSFGTASVFSFYATKLMTSVDGGAVCSLTPSITERVREFRYYRHRRDGRMRFNYKMQNLHAALGRSQLKKLLQFIERRHAIAHQFLGVFTAAGGDLRQSMHQVDGAVYFKLALRLAPADRDRLLDEAQQRGLPCSTEFDWVAEEPGRYPNAEHLMARIITLPVYPALTDGEVRSLSTMFKESLLAVGAVDSGEA